MKCFAWLFVCSLVTLLSSPFFCHGNVFGRINEKVLHVGEELFKESLPLQNGACLYHLQGLKPQMWYEVKISYPASIPASFSLQLERGTPDVGLNRGRKLLNTEKIIFKADGITSLTEQGEMSVLVNLEPEGVVALPGKQEREYAMFNIVCDELLLGIPHEAWYVVVLVLLCLVLAFMVPSFLPAFLLPKNGRQPLFDHTLTKAS
ncbi:caveolin-1 protein [Perilla frutescens var. hirtella]|nr:caveolin-1 protein [Perilla frutescens var. hirtella]